MTVLIPASANVARREEEPVVDDAQLAAAGFLARYRGRTLEAYRGDLRGFFQWAADAGLEVLKASRPQIELYVRAMEQRGLAATTIDRRLSTVCGFYRFAHIDGRIATNPAQYVRHPKIHPNDARGLDRAELGAFLFTGLMPLSFLLASVPCGPLYNRDISLDRALQALLWPQPTPVDRDSGSPGAPEPRWVAP